MFFDARFPDAIAQGATGGPRWKTGKNESASGRRFVNKDWSSAQHVYEVSQAIKTLADFETVRSFFYVVAGSFDAFRFKDYSNYRVSLAVGVLTAAGAAWQMFKAERYGSREYLRKITKPVSGTVTVQRNRGGSITTIAPAIDYLTGLATISGHNVGDLYTWSGEFDVPCYFVDDSMETAQSIGPDGGMLMSWPSIQLREDPEA